MARSRIKTLLHTVAEARQIWRQGGGVAGERKYFRFLLGRLHERQKYRLWVRECGIPDDREIAEAMAGWESRPLLSVVVPVYETDEKWLRRCIDSVLTQIYPRWELCIADDASAAAHIRPVLEEYARGDNRIKITFRSENGHISAASNSALELATGEFVVLLDHDDELAGDALFWIANEINMFPETAMIFTDEDLIDERGTRFEPKFKPDFSRDLFYSTNLITHLSAYRTDLLRRIGGFRIGFEGSQDYDIALRVIEQIDEDQIRHIPRMLYHWRVIRGSVAFSMDEKPYAHDRARQAIQEHLQRCGQTATVEEAPHHLHRVRYKIPEPKPCVSVIVSGDGDVDRGTGGFGDDYHVIPVSRSDDGYAEVLNQAIASAKGQVLIFLDDNLRIGGARAIEDLVSFAIQPEIGAVAGKILGPYMFVEQAGLVIQGDLSPAPAHHDHARDASGNISRNVLVGNVSAVSMSCMAISRKAFESVGGFDRTVPPGMIDIDLCLRLGEIGKRIVVVPDAEFIREGRPPERVSSESEQARFRERWSRFIERDPMCNPNLKRDGSFELL